METGKVIVGRCAHGFACVGIMEDHAEAEELEEYAHYYTLSREDSISFGGDCSECRARFDANMAMLKEKNS